MNQFEYTRALAAELERFKPDSMALRLYRADQNLARQSVLRRNGAGLLTRLGFRSGK